MGSTGNYARREGGRGSSWSGQVPAVTHRGTYGEPRGGQSNFTRGPLPSRQPPASKKCKYTRTVVVDFALQIFETLNSCVAALLVSVTSVYQVHIVWLPGTEPREDEEALGFLGSVREEAAAVLEAVAG